MSDAYRLPEHFETERHFLRRVAPQDAGAIFEAYATDETVTHYLGWRPHRRVDETASFVRRVAREWDSGAGYPLVVFARDAPDRLIGMVHPHVRGFTVNYGYVLRSEAWGKAAPPKSCIGLSITHSTTLSSIAPKPFAIAGTEPRPG